MPSAPARSRLPTQTPCVLNLARESLGDRQAAGSRFVTVRTRRSQVNASRLIWAGDHPVIVLSPPRKAHCAIVSVMQQPAHRRWTDGRPWLAPPVAAGSLCVLGPDREHAGRLVRPFDLLILSFDRLALEDIASDAGAAITGELSEDTLWGVEDSLVADLASLVLRALEGDAEDGILLNQLVFAAVLRVVRACNAVSVGTLRPGGLAPWQERKAKSLLAQNLGKDRSLVQVAATCRLSLSYFSRAFKVSVGMTPHQWVQALRVEKARRLLASTDAPVAEVAVECGFSDQSHFAKIFKRACGATPSAWRRLNTASASITKET